MVLLVGCGESVEEKPAQPSASDLTTPSHFEETKAKAEAGDAFAQNSLGLMYRNGIGVKKDYAKALEWHRKSAAQNNHYGQNSLGLMYRKGIGVKKDYAKALEWYRKSAAQNNHYTQASLGWMYQKGEGVTKDAKEAVKWYRKAVEQGKPLPKKILE